MENEFFIEGDAAAREQLISLYREYESSLAGKPFKNYGGYSYVWGSGDPSARLVIIGEAPGENEVKEGRPFVGKAGMILDEFLERTSLKRGDLFITNTVKYRLSRPRKGAPDSSGIIGESFISPKFLANRPASAPEIAHGASFLAREISIIRPRIVVTLGNVPLKAVGSVVFPREKALQVGELHGRPMTARVKDAAFTLFPIYHPASLIYDRGKRECYAEDLEKLKAICGERNVEKG